MCLFGLTCFFWQPSAFVHQCVLSAKDTTVHCVTVTVTVHVWLECWCYGCVCFSCTAPLNCVCASLSAVCLCFLPPYVLHGNLHSFCSAALSCCACLPTCVVCLTGCAEWCTCVREGASKVCGVVWPGWLCVLDLSCCLLQRTHRCCVCVCVCDL
jgi:hypothetical protein